MQRGLTIILTAVFVLALMPAAKAKRVALVVGINTYENFKPELQLAKALNDARSVTTTLKKIGYQVVAAEDTRRNDFLRAWQRFLDLVEPGDVTALYFAGHGFEINGANYLLVRDAPQVADGEEVLKGSAIRFASLMDRLKDKQAQVSLFILDACRNSPYANQSSKRSLGSPRGLVREEPPRGTLVMMSAGAGQEALDGLTEKDTNPNSIYTRILLSLLTEPGLEITDMAKRVRGGVETLAATVRHEQRPAFYHELSGDFYLVPGPEKATAAINGGGPAPNEAAQAWAVTKDTASQSIPEAFIRQFGTTFYGALARERQEELKRTQVATAAPTAAATATTPPAAPAAPAVGPNAQRPTPAVAPSAPSISPPSKPSAYASAQAWTAVKESNSAADVEAFLARHGESIYADAANARLDVLRRTQPVAVAAPSVLPPLATSPATPAAATPPVPHPVLPTEVTPVVGAFPRSAAPLTTAQQRTLNPRDVFRECAQCPAMIVVPAGEFIMGSPANEEGHSDEEGPAVSVSIANPFAVGEFAVTFDEWEACVAAGGCNGYRPADEGRRRGVINVSWDDAKAYVAWLSQTTGKPYRLLSEAEREFATRAGSTTPFWFGSSISTKQANFDGGSTYGGGERGEYRARTVPVGTFDPNPFGLYQVHGNIYEWVEDCWKANHQGAPKDGAARTTGDCARHVLRGGSWFDPPAMLRAAHRAGFYPGHRSSKIGFRVARSL